MTGFYTPQERQEVLALLLSEFEKDDRLAGVVIVGSAATGFEDAYSDIDLAVVVATGEDINAIYASWKRHLSALLPVVAAFDTTYSPTSLLLGVLLENYLELDIGFITRDNLEAKRECWQVAFDRSGQLKAHMRASRQHVLPPICAAST